MNEFHFLRPWWLLALIPLAGLLWMLQKRQGGGDDWREFCDAELLPYILVGTAAARTFRPLWLAALAGLLAVLALAGPAWERLPAPVFRNLSAMVIVLDLSWAMEAADLKPNRLERARYKIDDILRARKDGQTALVAYAGDAFVVTPLTDDAGTIAAQLTALSPRIMPEQGARMDRGLEAAARLLEQAGQKSGDILLLTTGEGIAEAESTAARLHDEGYRISALGVGTRDGAPLPLPDGGFLKDGQGGLVVSKLDVQALWNLTQKGGGLYHSLDAGSVDVDLVLRFVDRRAESGQQSGQDVHVEQWREGGIWLLPLLLPLAALAFRRGWLGVLLLTVLAPVPRPAQALEWKDLWLTPDQQAQRALRAGDPKSAAERFENPDWKAAAQYRAGEYDQAAKHLEKRDTAAAQYNRGNALAKQGQLEPALQAYDRALQLNPKDEDAQYNRKLVEEALRKQQEQQKQDQKDQQKGEDQDQQDQKSQSSQDSPQKLPEPQDQPGEHQQDRQNKPGGDSPQDQAQKDASQKQDKEQNGKPGEQQPGQEPPPDSPDQNEQAGQDDQEHPAPQPQNGQHDQAQAQAQPQPQPEKGNQAERKPVPTESENPNESQQAEAQWLRRIPDDPGGLLKRKFYYQYRQRQQQH